MKFILWLSGFLQPENNWLDDIVLKALTALTQQILFTSNIYNVICKPILDIKSDNFHDAQLILSISILWAENYNMYVSMFTDHKWLEV